MDKIKMTTPLVEMDGDEMTRILWSDIKEILLKPYIELTVSYTHLMATDYVTSPATPKGEIIFGIGCGLLTVFIRKFGGYPEGVSYAILIMNTCVWLLDKVGKPARFGVTKEMKEKQKAAKKAAKEAEAK